MNILDLVRPDLRDFAGYASARRAVGAGNVWLNANESPLCSSADPGQALNRYPEPQPVQLRARLAALYGVAPDALLITRGSDDGIDLLVRALCRAGTDAVTVSPPCFGMYAVCARVQGAPLVEVPLLERDGRWRIDIPGIVAAVAGQGARIVFVCSPGNPTGQATTLDELQELLAAVAGRALVVVDEAYAEYSDVAGAACLLPGQPGLAILRTLSKAHALAGARVGVVLATPALIGLLSNLAPPYPIAAPSAQVALASLDEACLAEAGQRCRQATEQREVVSRALALLPDVLTVYPSQGNFLLVRFRDAGAAFARLLEAGVVVRDMRAMPQLSDALRISIGTPEENAAMLGALQAVPA